MTEITRVPLQPIAKGALGKLWLGLALAVGAAGAVAYAAMPPLVSVKTVQAGTGASPTLEDVAFVSLEGKLKDGTVFQPKAQGPVALSQMIPGFSKALGQMQKGGKYHVVIPAELGYGDQANGPIPANSELQFDIEMYDFMPRQAFEQRQQMIEQMRAMQQQGGKPGAGGAVPPEGLPGMDENTPGAR